MEEFLVDQQLAFLDEVASVQEAFHNKGLEEAMHLEEEDNNLLHEVVVASCKEVVNSNSRSLHNKGPSLEEEDSNSSDKQEVDVACNPLNELLN